MPYASTDPAGSSKTCFATPVGIGGVWWEVRIEFSDFAVTIDEHKSIAKSMSRITYP